jgi:hypothetical protein
MNPGPSVSLVPSFRIPWGSIQVSFPRIREGKDNSIQPDGTDCTASVSDIPEARWSGSPLPTLSFLPVKPVGCYIQQKVHNRRHHVQRSPRCRKPTNTSVHFIVDLLRAVFIVALDNRVSCPVRILSVPPEVPGVSSPTRTLHPFWGNFRVGGDSPGTRKPKRLQRSMSASAILRQRKMRNAASWSYGMATGLRSPM